MVTRYDGKAKDHYNVYHSVVWVQRSNIVDGLGSSKNLPKFSEKIQKIELLKKKWLKSAKQREKQEKIGSAASKKFLNKKPNKKHNPINPEFWGKGQLAAVPVLLRPLWGTNLEVLFKSFVVFFKAIDKPLLL